MTSRTASRWMCAFLPLVMVGCGGVSGPDFGTVRGRIVGGNANGHAYVLGQPEFRVPLGADGSFELGLPGGTYQVVVYDGGDPAVGDAHAELLIDVEVTPQELREIGSKRREDMPLAAQVVAAARPRGGAQAAGASFTVERTIHERRPPREVAEALALAELGPLPAGTWDLSVSLKGFRPAKGQATVAAGQSGQVEMELEVEDGSEVRGCEQNGCCNDLLCSADDQNGREKGRCYQCLLDSDCEGGAVCDAGFCKFTNLRRGVACDACDGPEDCASELCVNFEYCARRCSSADQRCPAGYSCVGTQQFGYLCVLKEGVTCQRYVTTAGASCVSSFTCARSLDDGRCLGRDPRDPKSVGYCSVECDTDADCPRGVGFRPLGACQDVGLGLSEKYCTK